ncbi:hypothetical protein C2W62_36370 [Candidatus Entotheonella serta]|nr:hypothetical protein C2W62_36370 [Candidatus Entotheonella serta]
MLISHEAANNPSLLNYYLKLPANSGNIVFWDSANQNEFCPHLFNYNEKPNPLNARFTALTVEEGFMLIFPSKTRHSTEVSTSDKIRISISADISVTLKENHRKEFVMTDPSEWKKLNA